MAPQAMNYTGKMIIMIVFVSLTFMAKGMDDHTYVAHPMRLQFGLDHAHVLTPGQPQGIHVPEFNFTQNQDSLNTNEIINAVIDDRKMLEPLEDHSVETIRQDHYLSMYGLERQQIIGDGNCLFRAVSFALHGHQNLHLELRQLSTDIIEQNLDDFRNFFMSDITNRVLNDEEISNEIHNLRQPGTFARQESVFALSRLLGINILITVGGDQANPNVNTIEHNYSDSDRRIHLVWTRGGGGHYEAVLEHDSSSATPQDRSSYPHHVSEAGSSYKWNIDSNKVKVISLESYHDTESKLGDVHKHKGNTETEVNNLKQKTVNKLNFNKKCLVCSRKFYNNQSLKNHAKVAHSKVTKNRIACLVSTCNINFFHVNSLVDHLKEHHGAHIEIENLSFNNLEEFEIFLQEESLRTNTRFVQHRQKKVNKNKSQGYTLVCHRDGVQRMHRKKGEVYKRTRKPNRKGSCKIQHLCPSRMSVSVNQHGKCHVKYIKSHTHSLSFQESKYLPIPDNIRSEICTMLSLKMPINDILDKVRENASDRDKRDEMEKIRHYQLIDRKTIHNIKKKIIDSSVIRHSDDATSTFLRVNSLRKEKFDPILIYKQQGIQDTDHGLQKNDFMLALMTREQEQMYNKFANVILCMDSTHKTNLYSFKLITLLVPDEFRHGYPVAFCISNREDEHAISIFLNAVKSRNPDCKVNILMTDDDNAGWNAAQTVFGKDLKHFLCIWHIHRTWRRKLQQHIKDDILRTEVYSFLCAMQEAKSEQSYLQYQSALIERLKILDPALLKYLENVYFNRPEKWAMCYRTGYYNNVNTNMFIESFHNQLKSIYFGGKRNRRIDVLLETLLQIEKNLFINHYKQKQFKIPTSEDGKILDRHQKSLQISDSSVSQINENTFIIESSESNNNYQIERKCHRCEIHHDHIKCKQLPCVDLCSHLYTCSCPDYSNGNICKHLHKIQSFVCNDQFNEAACTEEHEIINVKSNKGNVKERDIITSKKYRIQKQVETILKQIENKQVEKYRIDSIISSLDNIISANEGCLNLKESEMDDFKRTEKISSNANNVIQPRFKSTQQKAGRKRTLPMKKPSQEEKVKLLDSTNLVQLPQNSANGQSGSGACPNTHANARTLPHVAPYPPLRLVPTTQPIVIQRQPSPPLFNIHGQIRQPSWMRIPPAMFCQRILIDHNGKKQHVIFSRQVSQPDDEPDK